MLGRLFLLRAGPVGKVHGVAAEAFGHELAQQVQLLVGGVGIHQPHHLLARGADLLQAVRDGLVDGVPVRGLQLAPHPGLWLQDALAAVVEPRVADAPLVAHPPAVDGLVLARLDAVDAVLVVLQVDVAARRARRAHRLRLAQLPGALAEAPVAVGDRPHRTDVRQVALELVHDLAVLPRVEGQLVRTQERAEVVAAHHVAAEALAAGALHAAVALEHDERAHVAPAVHALLVLHLRVPAPVAVRVVLQVALARLVADRAIQRVIDEQELVHQPLAPVRLLRDRGDAHLLRRGRGAGRLQLGHAAPVAHVRDLHQALPALRGDLQARVVAIVGNLRAGSQRCLEHRFSRLELHRLVVQIEDRHARQLA